MFTRSFDGFGPSPSAFSALLPAATLSQLNGNFFGALSVITSAGLSCGLTHHGSSVAVPWDPGAGMTMCDVLFGSHYSFVRPNHFTTKDTDVGYRPCEHGLVPIKIGNRVLYLVQHFPDLVETL